MSELQIIYRFQIMELVKQKQGPAVSGVPVHDWGQCGSLRADSPALLYFIAIIIQISLPGGQASS